MPKDHQKRATRQQPVSCRSCRSRKLRCNRELPCSNCASRGVPCELEDAVRPPAVPASSLESELLERVRKLERLAESQQVRQHEIVTQSHPTPVAPEAASPEIESLSSDIAYLEHKSFSNTLVFKNCPIGQIAKAPAYINRSTTSFEPVRCIWLPQYSDAKILVEKYVQDVDHIHHIVYTPSLSALLSTAYACLNVPNSATKHGGSFFLLFLGIFASATNSWTQSDCDRGLFSTCAEANAQAPLWVKALEDVLDITHRIMGVSIEGIQGVTIAAFVILSINHPSNAGSANLERTEMGRRLWWHLVASDWQAPARFDAAVSGVYHCHPRQMVVKKPLNLNDEDLVDGMSQDQKPLSCPTVMSYPLQRIRIAEIMLEIDTELQLFINDIPPFFSMTTTELEATYQLSPLRAISIVQQGFCLYSLTWSQRCRLHIPYFTRGFVELEYATSCDICLHSARQIIKTETLLSHSGLFTASRYKLLGPLTSVFMATVVVLFMNIIRRKSSTQRDILSGEIQDAIRIIENASQESETAAKFLESLMCVVSKHKVCKPAAQVKSAETCGDGAQVYDTIDTQAAVGSPPYMGNNGLGDMDIVHERPENGEDLSAYFNGLAQSFEQGVDVGSLDWDTMLSELERSLV
ncbi:hypothetical protein TCE0_060r19302 [Talaromyces pinophilus]|uniref:Zn(2)-C6 fungal-type domain-containing protein n=1 Tax=Talaromyces pinophilus TaxID=128442 RepID=A0A6V8HPY2_TALPI|nr:hypothetical protein TCE0_060r19302 [Talaromyces pinophilus]